MVHYFAWLLAPRITEFVLAREESNKMRARILLFVSVMLLLSPGGLTESTCTNGKVYTTCGTMCPLTCANKDDPPMVCPAACKIGCVCPQGMVENGDGCVLPENCPMPSYCQLPPVTGPCEAYIPSVFYNATSKECESFIYGGCGGNENRFSSVDTCTSTCRDGGKPSYCQLPPMSGDGIIMCLAYIPSYFYNSTSKKCESFIYGGCGGNENRFMNISGCMKTCGDQDTLRDDDDDSESYSWTYIGVSVALIVIILILVIAIVGILVVLKERRNKKRRSSQNIISPSPAKDSDYMIDQDFKGSPNHAVNSSDTVKMI